MRRVDYEYSSLLTVCAVTYCLTTVFIITLGHWPCFSTSQTPVTGVVRFRFKKRPWEASVAGGGRGAAWFGLSVPPA
jgi:hypothetical protein